MKKLSFLLAFVTILMAAGSYSCKKTENVQDNPPSVSLYKGTGFVSKDTTVKINTPLKFGIRAISNSSTGAAITRLNFMRNFNGQKNDTTYNLSSPNADLTTSARSQAGSEVCTMTVTDDKGATASVNVTITTVIPTGKTSTEPTGTIISGSSIRIIK